MGTPVKADASFSVSRALQLQLPKQLTILEEVSEYASREYSLERALDKMQVRYFLAQPTFLQHCFPLGSVSSLSMCCMCLVHTFRKLHTCLQIYSEKAS